MRPEDYEKDVKRTARGDSDPRVRILNWALGLGGECGEAQERIKKLIFHDEGDFDILRKWFRSDVRAELGDVLWYLTMLASEFDISLNEIMEANIQKLRVRYPEGFKTDLGRARE